MQASGSVRVHKQDQLPVAPSRVNITLSPVAARRSSLEERRRPAARFKRGRSASQKKGLLQDSSEEENRGEDLLENEDDEDGDDRGELSPLLPIFSAEHLDSLPVYNITHTLRMLIVSRCETTLSWDQLRSPQVSQFMVKPIQQQISASHFSKATLYALMANCLQFLKEIQTFPGNSGISKTRAMISELLTIRLLREFSTRDLIGDMLGPPVFENDALSYDFYPLQGLVGSSHPPGPNWTSSIQAQSSKSQGRVARISTLEIAIRAQAKRLLAHPLVIQQLEAIWAGTIVFHHAADNLHRTPVKMIPNQNRGYGTSHWSHGRLNALQEDIQPAKQRDHRDPVPITVRRSASLYDPKQASLFKLSRLRVPRYRQFLSTCSFAVMLSLYVAVLVERSSGISALEILFWFWSAGYLLDEVVGFNEQGFSLYLMSFWNTFDVGILLLLIFYYSMRIYGILLPSIDDRKDVAGMAFDLLAANAVLLFPRLFSVLDHYRYFSQLLIAFRMMAMDLVAIFILIVISCSGFFVAFTLSFDKSDGSGAASVAYALFQILMGYTPAAWESWPTYNPLGKLILTLFLFICHFLIITILITVLTNSFMSVVQNANEEHQFVFAVNTISMVKSDALFSYVAPTNVIAWLLAPLRFTISFRQFVKINRVVIKATHFPILFSIFAYERLVLCRASFEATDLVDSRGRTSPQLKMFKTPGESSKLLGPRAGRMREPSVATQSKDRALEEVFRGAAQRDTTLDSRRRQHGRETSNVVKHWMSNLDPNDIADPPMEQDQSIVDRLEGRRIVNQRSQIGLRRHRRESSLDFALGSISVASDPEEFATGIAGGSTKRRIDSRRMKLAPRLSREASMQTDADGDDELRTNDDEDVSTYGPGLAKGASTGPHGRQRAPRRLPAPGPAAQGHKPLSNLAQSPRPIPEITRFDSSVFSGGRESFGAIEAMTPLQKMTSLRKEKTERHHSRMPSTTTIIYDPPPRRRSSTTSSSSRKLVRRSGKNTGSTTPNRQSNGRRTPKGTSKATARPILPPRTAFQSTPNLFGMLALASQPRRDRRSSLTTFEIGSDLGDNKAVGGGFVGAAPIPASFATQMAHAHAGMRARKAAQKQEAAEDKDRMSRLVLTRMNTLEEGFKEVVREVQELRKGVAGQALGSMSGQASAAMAQENVGKKGSHKSAETKSMEADGLTFMMDREDKHGGSSL